MQCFKNIFSACLFLLLLMKAFAQNDSLQNQFAAYNKNVLQEKLFVHTDKNIYIAGEILWFKIYDVDAFFHMPLNVSSVAYVEILDKNNKPVLQSKLALNKGDGDGSVFIPVTFNSGNYTLRAYTSWMKNFSPEYFFEKIITIINAQKITDTVAKQNEIKYNIAFFPEGGNLINNIQSKVAFKISDQFGKGIDCKGILVSNNNDTVQTFHSLKFGMGNFTFTPDATHSYKAIIIFPDGKQIIKELPQIYNNGFAMHMQQNESNQLKITVNQTANNTSSRQAVYLLVNTRGSVKFFAGNNIQNDSAIFLIDATKLGDGISQFTVFNNAKQPVCERLYFTYPKNKLQLSLQTNSLEYDCRKKATIHISSGDKDGNPLRADISLAIYHVDSLQTIDETSIENYLLLTSDLKGTIESPNYYFKNNDSETQEAIDNLMLTNGWRRFNWDDVLQNKKPAFSFVPEVNGHIIYGKIIDTKTGLPGANINGFLSVPGINTQFRNALSDGTGRIKFEMKNFYGSSEIIVQTNTQQDSNYRIDISSPFTDNYSEKILPRFLMPEKNPHTLLYENINTQVQNIYTDNKLQQFKMPVTNDTTAFYTIPDERYVLDDYTRFTTLEEIIREYVLGVNITKREGKFHLKVTQPDIHQPYENEPLVLLDGVPVFDINKFISNDDPLKMYKLDVITKRYFLGYQSFDGILNFVTYKGDLAGHELDPHAIAIDYEGLQLQRKFYSPEYDTGEKTTSHLPDFRNLLYWSPEIKTNAQGKNEESFYTSDIPGKYVVIAQGLSSKGFAGSQIFYFNVKGKTK